MIADLTETRAAALGEVLRQAARVPGPITLDALFMPTMGALNLPEEQCGGEINDAIVLFVRCGLLHSNTLDAHNGLTWLTARTVLSPSKLLIHLMWSERVDIDALDPD